MYAEEENSYIYQVSPDLYILRRPRMVIYSFNLVGCICLIFICRHLLFKQKLALSHLDSVFRLYVCTMVVNKPARRETGRGSNNTEPATAEYYEIGTETGSVAREDDDEWYEDSAVGVERVEEQRRRWNSNRVAQHQEQQRVAALDAEIREMGVASLNAEIREDELRREHRAVLARAR